jgi:hypothetical protein
VKGEAVNRILVKAPRKEKDKNILPSAEWKVNSKVHDSHDQFNLINTNELLYCSYIPSNTVQFPF